MPTPEETARAVLDRAVEVGQLNLQPVAMTRKEISQEISLARFYLSDRAPKLDDDPDAEYMFLYDGCVVAVNAICHAFGYRSKGESGHETVLLAAEGLMKVLEPGLAKSLRDVRLTMRDKRHQAQYERVGAVSPEDLAFARATAGVVVAGLTIQSERVLGNSPGGITL